MGVSGTGESSIITILNDFDVLVADWEPSNHDAHINSFVGKRVPAYCTGAGKAILGLGDRGALASKPVMEWKGVLFKRFADVDVFDIELDTRDPDKNI